MLIEIEVKNVYGVPKIYPVSEGAKILAAIAGTKTLSVEDIKNANKLGLTVVEVKQNYAPIAAMCGVAA